MMSMVHGDAAKFGLDHQFAVLFRVPLPIRKSSDITLACMKASQKVFAILVLILIAVGLWGLWVNPVDRLFGPKEDAGSELSVVGGEKRSTQTEGAAADICELLWTEALELGPGLSCQETLAELVEQRQREERLGAASAEWLPVQGPSFEQRYLAQCQRQALIAAYADASDLSALQVSALAFLNAWEMADDQGLVEYSAKLLEELGPTLYWQLLHLRALSRQQMQSENPYRSQEWEVLFEQLVDIREELNLLDESAQRGALDFNQNLADLEEWVFSRAFAPESLLERAEEGLLREPESTEFAFERAVAYALSGETQMAVEQLKALIELQPQAALYRRALQKLEAEDLDGLRHELIAEFSLPLNRVNWHCEFGRQER